MVDNVPRMRADMKLNDPVTVTLPAWVWLSFDAAYTAARWHCDEASLIAIAIQEQMMDPVFLKEREARHQQEHDRRDAFMDHVIGRPPDVPPNMEEPS